MKHYLNLTHGGGGSEISLKKKAFTLAEALITLAIIGVVAALTIPSIIVETQQSEYKTGLKKAVSVLNSAIGVNKATDGETPYNTANLFLFFQKRMNVVGGSAYSNYGNNVFYTADGMRFEFGNGSTAPEGRIKDHYLYENGSIWLNSYPGRYDFRHPNGQTNAHYNYNDAGVCGSYGLINNPQNTDLPPCLIMVDINGEKGPTKLDYGCSEYHYYGSDYKKNCKTFSWSKPDGSRLSDVFSIMITDSAAIPYGTAAQKAMYGDDN